MKRLIFALSGAWALVLVLVPACSFGPDKYSGPFIDEAPPPDDMTEGATAGTGGSAASGGADSGPAGGAPAGGAAGASEVAAPAGAGGA